MSKKPQISEYTLLKTSDFNYIKSSIEVSAKRSGRAIERIEFLEKKNSQLYELVNSLVDAFQENSKILSAHTKALLKKMNVKVYTGYQLFIKTMGKEDKQKNEDIKQKVEILVKQTITPEQYEEFKKENKNISVYKYVDFWKKSLSGEVADKISKLNDGLIKRSIPEYTKIWNSIGEKDKNDFIEGAIKLNAENKPVTITDKDIHLKKLKKSDFNTPKPKKTAVKKADKPKVEKPKVEKSE